MPPSIAAKRKSGNTAAKAASRTKSAFETSLQSKHTQDDTDSGSESGVDMDEGEDIDVAVNTNAARQQNRPTTSKVIPEKDETEKKLESLLFGDDDGFHVALKETQQQERGMMGLVSQQSGDADDASGNEEQAGFGDDDDDLANVADADVGGLSPCVDFLL